MSKATIFWWLILALGGGGCVTFLISLNESERASEHQTHISYLIGKPLSELAALEVVNAGTVIRFERGASGWQRKRKSDARTNRHHPDPDERVRMLAAARIERTLRNRGSDFRRESGLTGATLEVNLFSAPSGPSAYRSLIIGARTPDGFGQYVELRPSGDIVVTPAFHVENLRNLVGIPSGGAGVQDHSEGLNLD